MNKLKLTSAVLYLLVAVMTAGMGITFITVVECFLTINKPQGLIGLKFNQD